MINTAIHVIWKASKTILYSANINYKYSTEVKSHFNRLSLLRLLHMEVAVLRMSVISKLTVYIKIYKFNLITSSREQDK